MRLRRSARVFLFDECDRLLLIRFRAMRSTGEFIFWVTAGGEVEPGEPDRMAAERELFEELGVRAELLGPVEEQTGGTYEHLGEVVRNYDVFFAARCRAAEAHLAGVTADEIQLMQEARWWTLEELAATRETMFPATTLELARRSLALLKGA